MRILKRFILILVLALIAGATGIYIDWHWKRPLSPRGGRYFFHRVELPVPSFRQGDERWRDDPLGGVSENGTMGEAGCAVAAAAMVFESYGIETDPQQLNWFLTAVGGYTDQGWLYWDRAAWWAPDRVRHIYEDLPSYDLIDSNLARGNPVIVRVRFSSGITHFVVIAGKDGFDYLIRDPGAGAAKGYYPLRELGSNIEALRFYERVTLAKPPATTAKILELSPHAWIATLRFEPVVGAAIPSRNGIVGFQPNDSIFEMSRACGGCRRAGFCPRSAPREIRLRHRSTPPARGSSGQCRYRC